MLDKLIILIYYYDIILIIKNIQLILEKNNNIYNIILEIIKYLLIYFYNKIM